MEKNINDFLKRYELRIDDVYELQALGSILTSNIVKIKDVCDMVSEISPESNLLPSLKNNDFPLYVTRCSDSMLISRHHSWVNRESFTFQYLMNYYKSEDFIENLLFTKNICSIKTNSFLFWVEIKMVNGDVFKIVKKDEEEYNNLLHDIYVCESISIK